MNFAGKFGPTATGSPSGVHLGAVELPHHGHAGAFTVSDPYLLFSGDYKRSGPDLILSKDGREHVVENYFIGEKRAALAAPDGAQLSGDIVSALTGHVQYAQASGAPDAGKVIGHVTKLAGNATVIRNGVSIVLNMGDNVHKGDVVQSGSNSQLGITFIDGTVFGLASNARMVLNDMVYDPNGSSNSSFLSLVQGTITFLAGETAKHGDMKIGTPVATMGIRGTACQVEIGFDVQLPDPNSTTPLSIPVKFRVLQEKDGSVGSYLLFANDDLTFSNPIATINQAGQVTTFNANGQITVTQLAQIAPEVKQITDFVLGLSSGNNPTPGSGVTPDSGTPKDTTPLKDLPVGTPTPLQVPINFENPLQPGQIIHETVNVTVTVLKKVDVAPVVDKSNFDIATQVTITDSNPSDVLTPYVPGSGKVEAATGPAYTPAGIDLKNFVTVDPSTGHVSYDPAGFAFLKAGDKAVVTIGFDASAGSDIFHESVMVTITGINDAPVIDHATVAVPEGGTVVLTAANIGVTDPDSTGFVLKVSNVAHGVFQTTTDGVTWVDAAAFTTADLAAGHVRFVHDGGEGVPTFSIQADDGEASNHLSATVAGTIDFTNVNDAPVITTALLTLSEGSTVVLDAASIGVTDPDNTSFIFTVSSVSHGTFQTTADGNVWVDATTFTTDELNAGHVRFAHDGGEDAPSFSITADDGAAVNHQSATVEGAVNFTNINDAPVIGTATLAVSEGGTVVLTLADIGVTDPDSSSFVFTVSGVSHGTFQITTDGTTWVDATAFTTGDLDAGYVRFVHDGGEDAPTFSIRADDGAGINHLSNLFAGNVDFTNVNDTPVITSATLTISEGDTVVLSAANVGVSDPDSSSFVFIALDVSHGTFQTTTDGTTWVDAGTFTSDDLDAGHVRFVHDGGEDAPTFSIQAYDSAGGDNLSNVLAGTVDFTNVNDVPVVTSATLTISEGDTVVLTAADIGVTDPDSTSFTFTVSNVSHGTFQTTADGTHWADATTFTTADLNARHVRFVHDGGEDAPKFSIQADDGAGINHFSNVLAGAVTFTNVNDAPVIAGGDFASLSIAENTTAVETVHANDPDGPSLTYSIVGGFGSPDASSFKINSTTGALSFIHAPDFENPADSNRNNIYTVQVKVSDGSLSDTQTLFIHVTDVNEAPHAVNDTVITNNANNSIYEIPNWALLANDTDPDGNTLSLDAITHSSEFASIDLTTNPGNVTIHDLFVGGAFTYRASDGSLSDTANVTVTQDTGTMNGGSGNEIFIGDSSGSTINANGGNDILIGNAGNDTLNGGSGNDTYVFGLHDGLDVINDTSGLDTIRIEAGGAALSGLSFAENTTHDLVIQFNGQQVTVDDHFIGDDNVGGLLFDGGASYDGYSLGSDRYFLSNDGGSSRNGTSGNDILSGDGHANSLSGGDGNDLLFGNAGSDTLNGGSGNDLLIGGSGNDTMTGGSGNDQFVFAPGFGKDIITDFEPGHDKIDLFAVVSTNNVNGWIHDHVAQSLSNVADTLITIDASNTITLHNVLAASLHAGDFIVHPVT